MKTWAIGGEELVDAQPAFDQNSQPVVSFRFNTQGAITFGEITSENVGRRFAIVLDGQVITAPTIQQPITGGTGQISGNFQLRIGERSCGSAAGRRASGYARCG